MNAETDAAKVDWVSSGKVDIVDDELSINEGLMIAGPFGHRMLMTADVK